MNAALPFDRSGLAPALARIVALFETLTEADIDRLGEHYSAQAFFKDPFNEVRTRAGVEGIFAHMFTALDGPRFVIRDAVLQGDQCFLTWDFLFRMKRFSRDEQCIRGATQIRFAPDGRIAMHRDWWDAAEELYEKLPVVGGLMRWLKKRANS